MPVPRVSKARIATELLRCNLAALWPGVLRLARPHPLYANLWLTTRCSGRCQTCTLWRQGDAGELDTNSVKLEIVRLRAAGVRIVYFVGGDVLLRDDIFELIRFAAELGLRTHLTLNAFTINEENAPAMRAAPMATLHLSLDTLTDDFDRIRGTSDAAGKVRHAIDLLRADGPTPFRLGISATIMKRTIPAIPDVVRFALANDLTVYFNLIHWTHDFFSTQFSRDEYETDAKDKQALSALVDWLKRERLKHPQLLPRLDHLEWIRKYFDDFHQAGTPCLQTLLKICVQPNGDVRPCCSMDTAGNMNREEIAALLGSRPYIESIRRALSKDCPGCSCRYTLNLDASPASWLREFRERVSMGWRSTKGAGSGEE